MRSWLADYLTGAKPKEVPAIPIAPSLYSLGNEIGNSLLTVRDVNYKYIVIGGNKYLITPIEIANKTMTEEKKKQAKKDIFAFYIGRPISYVLTIPFISLGIKPNVISFMSLFPSVLGFILLSFLEEKKFHIIGVLLFLLWNFMDGIDGNVARYTEQTSTLGILWDATSGYVAMVLMYFSIGISVIHNPRDMFEFLYIPDYYYLVMAGLTAISTLLARLIMHKKILLFNDKSGSELNNKSTYSFFKIIALNLVSPSGFMQIIILLSVIFDCVRECVIVYFFIHALITIYSLKDLLKE